MKNIGTNLAAIFIVLIVVFFIARIFALANIEKQVEQLELELSQYESSAQQGQVEYETLKAKLQNSETPIRSNKLLRSGEEALLLKELLRLGGKSLRLNSYEMLPAFHLKPDEDEMFSENAFAAPVIGEELPQLDDQGMPVGLAGVEIVPVKMTFTSTYRSFGRFSSEAVKNLPINAVRSMDLLLKNEGIVKGTLVMNFPVAESGN